VNWLEFCLYIDFGFSYLSVLSILFPLFQWVIVSENYYQIINQFIPYFWYEKQSNYLAKPIFIFTYSYDFYLNKLYLNLFTIICSKALYFLSIGFSLFFIYWEKVYIYILLFLNVFSSKNVLFYTKFRVFLLFSNII